MTAGARTLAFASWAIALTPGVALACPVCFGANEANRDAFVATTVFLSLLPVVMIGGVIHFLVSRARAADAEIEAARTAALPPEVEPKSGGASR